MFQCVAYTTDAARSMRCTERQCAAYPMDATFSTNQHRTKQRMIKNTQGLLGTLCKNRLLSAECEVGKSHPVRRTPSGTSIVHASPTTTRCDLTWLRWVKLEVQYIRKEAKQQTYVADATRFGPCRICCRAQDMKSPSRWTHARARACVVVCVVWFRLGPGRASGVRKRVRTRARARAETLRWATAAVLRNAAVLPNPRHGHKGSLSSDSPTLAPWVQTCATGSQAWAPQPLTFATRPHAFCLER